MPFQPLCVIIRTISKTEINVKREEKTMEEERDLVEFEDDQGNKITMEVLDYLFYEGKEYGLLAELEDENADESSQREAYVMEIVPVGEDMEEFVPVEEELAKKLIDIIENSDFDEEFVDVDEEE